MIKYENFLNEKYGSNDIVDILTNQVYDLLINNFFELIISKELILKDKILNIKYKNINIVFNNTFIIFKKSDKNYGSINTNINIVKKKENKKEYIYINDLVITIEINHNPNIFIKGIISHEFLHFIELIFTKNEIKKLTSKNIKKNSLSSNSFKQDKILKMLIKKYKNDKSWQEISFFIYFTFKHEIRANVSEITTRLEYEKIDNIENIVKYLKNTDIYKNYQFIEKISISKMMEKFKKDENYLSILKDFNNKFLKKNNGKNIDIYERNFINFFNKNIKRNAKYALKKIIKISYLYETEIDLLDDIIYYKENYNFFNDYLE